VLAVAVRTAGDRNIAAKITDLGMERVAVGGQLGLVAGTADGRGLCHRRPGDGVSGVAVRTYGRLLVSAGHGLAVDTGHVLREDASVALSAGSRDRRPVGWALRVRVAQNMVRSVATFTVCRHQQAFLADSVSVDGIHVLRIDIGQVVLLGHRRVSMAFAAGGRNVERIDFRFWIVLGKDRVSRSVTSSTRLIRRMLMHAADKLRRFLRMAGNTLYRLGVVGMRVRGDGRMTGAATEITVHAGVKDVSIDADIMACAILHGDVAVAGEAVRLRVDCRGERREDQHRECRDEGLPAKDSLRDRRDSMARSCRRQ